jgi:type II secretory pathway pseudopilin PulG
LELIAVLTILGIAAAIAVTRLSPAVLSNVGAQNDARRLALDLLAAQRRAIATGDNHYLSFTNVNGQLQGYSVYRVTLGGDTVVDSYRQFAPGVTVTGNSARSEFTFSGSALAAYVYTLAGPDRSWQIAVVPVSGTVRVTEVP